MGRFFEGQPLWAAALLWVLYLAVEPYVRRFWPQVVAWWEKAKEGGAILGRPGTYFGRVFLPSFIGWPSRPRRCRWTA